MKRRTFGTVAENLPRALIIVAMAALIWGSIFLHLDRARQTALRQAHVNITGITRMAEAITARTVEAVDQALMTTRELYRRDPAGFTVPAWARDTAYLNGLNIQLAVADATGQVVASSLDLSGPPVSIADREHFRVPKDNPDDTLFISKPLVGRVSKRASVQFVRPIHGENGVFMGVVVASLDPVALSWMYEAADLGKTNIILTTRDGVLRAAWPDPAGLEQRQADPEMMRRSAGEFEDTYRVGDADDGWITGFRYVSTYPLLISTRIDTRDAIAGYLEDRRHVLLIGLGLTILLLCLQDLQLRHRRRIARYQQALDVTLDNISQGILMVDRFGQVAVVNRRTRELLDLPPDLAKEDASFPQIVAWLTRRGEFDTPDAARIRMLTERGGLDDATPLYERTRPNGTVLEVRTAVLPDGSAVRTYTDLTDRKEIERQLAVARDAAEAGSKARSEFLRVMSHEIRTPLNGILGAIGLMRDLRLDTEADHYAAIVQQAGNHLLMMVDDILDVSSLDTGRLTLKPAPFDPAMLVTGVAAMMRPDAAAKGLTLDVAVAPSVPAQALGDGGRVRQVLVNLIGNAIKFTDHGGVTVTADAETDPDGSLRLRVAVTDTGIGIPAERQGDLFQLFTQLDGSLSRRHEGTGMGLAISNQLVGLMGGSIGVTSVPEQGSTFHFDIRLDCVRVAEPVPPTAPAERAAPLRVLIAEDNPTNRLVATRMVSRMGHHVDTVEDGAEAVATLRREQYDVVLMDLMMPRMDGITATRAIRAEPPPLDATPIIGLTANARADDEAACRAAGMDGFLTKPVSAERLSSALLEVVGSMSARVSPPPP